MNKIILFLIFISCTSSFAQTIKHPNRVEVDEILKSYGNPDEPGMTIGIVQDGEIVYENAIGMADLSNNISILDSTVFNIASVSKQFTGFLTLMAVEEGKILLKDDITVYLPELKSLPSKITIEQLANHTHGLPNYSNLIGMIGYDLSFPIRHDQAIQTMLEIEQVNFEAGAEFQYGNSGFMLLAEILERVYEKPFPVLVKEKIFTPLNMNQSSVVDDPNTIIHNKAQAYRRNGDIYVEHPNRQMECGSSNIHTTLGDMMKWMINFQQQHIGTKDMYHRMIENIVLNDGSTEEYGLGLYTGKYKGLDIVFHGGGTAGYRAYVLHVSDFDLSIVTLGNYGGFDGLLIVHDLLDLYLKEHLIEPSPVKTSYTAQELKDFEGTYRFQPGAYWEIRADDQNLYFGADTIPLPSIGDGRFEFFLPTSYLTFSPNSMLVQIADMRYHCEKIHLDPPVLDEAALQVYVGVFKNMEFNTFYEIELKNEMLIAKHVMNGEFKLHPLSVNSFYTASPLGELEFQFNREGEVNGFVLCGQNMKNIMFMKVR